MPAIVAQAGRLNALKNSNLPPIAQKQSAGQRFSRLGSLAMNDVQTLRHDLVGIVGELHAALQEIGGDSLPQAGIVNNTRDRLRYIATLTEQAASQSLHAAESISDSLHAQQAAARPLLRKVRSAEARAFLQELDAQHQQALGQVNEIIQAQAFQDLVGQVINKLMLTVEKMEASLAHLLLEEEADPGLLAGPQVHPAEQVSQADIDNLFD
jgi:chemotaxis protein CheZ